jgi:hypothetical protein
MDVLEKLIWLVYGVAAMWSIGFARKRYMKMKRERQARTYLTEQVNEFELVKIYESKDEQGKHLNWYAFVNPLKLPAARAIAGEIAMKQAEMNIDRDTLLEFITNMKEAANKGDITQLFYDLVNMEQRANYACEEETLLSLACVYVLIEGEDPRTIAEGTQKRKRELMKSSDEMRAFFLTCAFKLTGTYSDISATDMLNYLNDLKYRQKAGSAKGKMPANPKPGGIFSRKLVDSSTKSTSKTSGSAASD